MIGSRRLRMESLESRELLSATPNKFYVVDDATANISYRYSGDGTAQGSSALVAANSAPKGVATMIGVDKSWVLDANRNVYVYDSSGALLGSWSAGSMANNAAPEGIATDGNDVWIVDSKSDKVFHYAGAASRLSGSQNAASSFALSSSNSNPKDMVTDGYSLWVVDDAAKTDKIFKYNLASGSLVGSWTIDAANKSPTGIALDPANIGDMWISDSGTDRVYKYAAATSRDSGSQSASSSFALAKADANAQGIAVAGRPWTETPYQVEWVRQFGSAGDDWVRGVTVDSSGNVYASGGTTGDLGGPNTYGLQAPYLAKFDAAGNQTWMQRQPGISAVEYGGVRVATDAAGNVYQVVNVVSGTYASALCSYDSAGNFRWETPISIGEQTFSVTADNLDYAYIASYEGTNVHVRKFDEATGNVVWEKVVNTGGTCNSTGISADQMGNIYVGAYTSGSLLGPNAGGYDALLMKLDDAGNVLWTRQFGTSSTDYGFIVSADSSGNVYFSGQTYGSLAGPNAGDEDNFLAKYDGGGNQLWVKQWGTSGGESSSSSWVDSAGNVYRAMSTGGALGGAHYGDTDIVVAKYDPSGNLMWATQLGTTGTDISYGGLWGDNQGNLYVAGKSSGSLGGPNPGGDDAVLIKLSAPGSSGAEAARSLVRSGAASTTTASILSTPDATKAGKAHSVAALASGQSISNHDSSENLAGLLAVYSRSTVDKFTRQMPSSHDLDARDRAIGELMNGELQDTLTDVLKLL